MTDARPTRPKGNMAMTVSDFTVELPMHGSVLVEALNNRVVLSITVDSTPSDLHALAHTLRRVLGHIDDELAAIAKEESN